MSWIAVGQTGRVGEEEEGWCSCQHAIVPHWHNTNMPQCHNCWWEQAKKGDSKDGEEWETGVDLKKIQLPSQSCCPKQLRGVGTKSMVRRRIGKTLDILSKQLRTHFFILRWECRHAADSECAEKLTEEMKYLRKTVKYAQNNPRELKICVSMKGLAKNLMRRWNIWEKLASKHRIIQEDWKYVWVWIFQPKINCKDEIFD